MPPFNFSWIDLNVKLTKQGLDEEAKVDNAPLRTAVQKERGPHLF